MMHRTQVSLEAEEHRRARKRANELGISLAEYIRRVLRQDLQGPELPSDPSTLFDLGDSGGSDIAASKDAYVGEAIASPRRR